MKQARDLLLSLLDNTNLEKAGLYSSFFRAWPEIIGRDAANHSRVRDCSKGIVLIDVDHPGWMQTISMRKQEIISKLQRRYPELEIVNIRIMHENVEKKDEGTRNIGSTSQKPREIERIKNVGLVESLSRLADRIKEAAEDEP